MYNWVGMVREGEGLLQPLPSSNFSIQNVPPDAFLLSGEQICVHSNIILCMPAQK